MNNLVIAAAASGWWSEVSKALPQALVNTVLGISIVFVSLIVISFIISLFKYINKLDAKLKARSAQKTQPAQTVQPEESEELTDDLELVAVISAAVAAYEEAAGNSSDGLVVRSIKKISRIR